MLIKLAVLLALTQMSFAETPASCTEDLEENISYPYPFYYDTDAVSDEDAGEHESKDDLSKDKSPTAQHAKIGNAEITVDVENTDFLSQCQAQWDKMQNKGEQKKKRSNSKKNDDKEDTHSPRAKLLVEWSTEN